MRHTAQLVAMLCVVFAMSSPLRADAQNNIRTVDPTSFHFELSGKEPPPRGVPAILGYGGGAVGGAIGKEQESLNWYYLPSDLAQESFLVACGKSGQGEPRATLKLPSGTTKTLQLAQRPMTGDGCFGYLVPFVKGTELGMYTLTLDHSQDRLSHTWGIDYPYCKSIIHTISEPRHYQEVLMGFEPNEKLRVYMYLDVPDSNFLAVREATTDSDGAVILDISLTRSAPYALGPTLIVNSKQELIFTSIFSDNRWSENLKEVVRQEFKLPSFPASKYPNLYRTEVDRDSDHRVKWALHDSESCKGVYGRFALTAPRNGSVLALYAAYEDTSRKVGSLPMGIPVEILEQRVSSVTGRVDVWYKLRDEMGTEGWAFGHNLATILPSTDEELKSPVKKDSIRVWVVGIPVKNSPNCTHDSLKTTDSGNRTKMVQLLPGTRLIPLGNGLYKTTKGDIGTFVNESCTGLVPLPWPADARAERLLSSASVSSIAPTATASQAAVRRIGCPNSPLSLLRLGDHARVTLGDGITILSAPNGPQTGRIPSGSQFDVVGGPECGDSGRTYWKINYNGTVGWTAEGEGIIYWVEPIK